MIIKSIINSQKILYQTQYCRTIKIKNNESSDLSDYQVCLEFDSLHNNADPNNLVFEDLKTGNYLPYWVEEWKRPSGKTKIWIKLDLEADETREVRLYYHGLVYNNYHDGDEVFEFFDDFDGDNLNLDKWEGVGTFSYSISNSLLEMDSSFNGNDTYIYAKYNLPTDYIIETCYNCIDGNHDARVGINLNIDTYNYVTCLLPWADGDSRIDKVLNNVFSSNYIIDLPYLFSTSQKVIIKVNNNVIKTIIVDDEVVLNNLTVDRFGNYFLIYKDSDDTLYYDYVFVRKYTANEPTISIGNEYVLQKDWTPNYPEIIIPQRYTKKRRIITITNNNSEDLENYQCLIEIDDQDFLNSVNLNNLVFEFNDVILPYWIEEWKRPSGKAKIWIKVPFIESNDSINIYMYYNGLTPFSQNGDDVFEFFDDFENSTKFSGPLSGFTYVNNTWLKENSLSSTGGIGYYLTISNLDVRLKLKYSNYQAFALRLANSSNEEINVRSRNYYTNRIYGDVWNGSSFEKNSYISIGHLRESCFFRITKYSNTIQHYYKSIKDNDWESVGASINYAFGSISNVTLIFDSLDHNVSFDYIFVKKYITNEPTTSINKEESIYKKW